MRQPPEVEAAIGDAAAAIITTITAMNTAITARIDEGFRNTRTLRSTTACPVRWWAFTALSASPGARAYYDQHRAAGDTDEAALRRLASKLIGQLPTARNTASPTTRQPPRPSLKQPEPASRLTQHDHGVSRPRRAPARRLALGPSRRA
jgi:hypothetical protein